MSEHPLERSGPAVMAVTALAYAVIGWLSLRLAISPSYASPIFPAAGLALAAALVYGRWGLAGVWLGSSIINVALGIDRGQLAPAGVAAGLVIGAGAALQAGIGRWMVRRWVSQPLTLSEPRDLARFYLLAAPVASLVSASVSTPTLLVAGVLPAGQLLPSWWTWWIGDTLGVLIAAPIALTLFGRPREHWAQRRRLVALPLLAATALLAAATSWVLRAHEQRLVVAFERDAWAMGERLEAQLRGPQRALLAMHGLFDTQQSIDPEEMRRAARAWLDDQPFLVAVGYSERVARTALPLFEARVRAEGPVLDFGVFDRPDLPAAAAEPEVLAIRYIEPLQANRRALGVNQRSIPAAREAIERAVDLGGPAATAGFRLTQAAGDETGVVLYRPLFRGDPADAAARREALVGLVFVTLRLDAMISELFARHPGYLAWCVVDRSPGVERARLAGVTDCDSAPATGLHYERALDIGGREVMLRVEGRREGVPGVADGGGWLFSVIGLLSASLMGALLLVVSGRQQRIEAAVSERTADLARAGRALLESEERLRSIVDHVPIGVVYTDLEGRVREANPALLAMLGLAALPVPVPRLADWADAADRDALQALVHALAEGRGPVLRQQLRLCAADGRVLTVKLALTALHDTDGRPRRIVGVLEDVGEHLRLLDSERAREQAEASSRAKSEFVGRMSHELRTPLNAMLGFAQLMARDNAPPLAGHQLRWAGQIQDAGWHLLAMINDTLDLSMIESGSVRLAPQALDPVALLDATLSLVAAAAERRRVTLVPPRHRSPGLAVRGDETRVKQILTNLLTNAVKYNVEGGRVAVDVGRTDDGQVEVLVHDTGLGLDAQQLENLFQPFNRLGHESGPVEGTGIGLVISRRLAEVMGGSLQARSEPGEGSTFVLRLPAAEVAVAPAGPAARRDADDAHYRRRHVHYVEDNETNVVLMGGMLAQRPQIELTVSMMGLDALVAIRADPPDLILLDMHLPDVDGLDLLHQLKQDLATAAIPVLVLSADATRERIDRAMAEGAAGYLPKPLNLGELLARVDELLEQVDTRWG